MFVRFPSKRILMFWRLFPISRFATFCAHSTSSITFRGHLQQKNLKILKFIFESLRKFRNHSDDEVFLVILDNFAFLDLKVEFFLSEENFLLLFFILDSLVMPSRWMAVLANFRLSCRLAFFILRIYSGTSPPDLLTSMATFLKSVLSSSVKKVMASPDLPARPVLPILYRKKIQKLN